MAHSSGSRLPARRYAKLQSSSAALLPFGLLAAILLGYLLLIYDRYLPPQEGWFQYDVSLMRQGRVPYRDFYLHIQPLYLLLLSWIDSLGGHTLIAYRIYGVAERVVLAWLVFAVLKRMFAPAQAFIATILGAFVYSSFNVDIPYSYYQTSLLLALLSGVFFERSLRTRTTEIPSLLLSGFLTGVAFFTRQSMGILILLTYVCVLVAVCYVRHGIRRMLESLAFFLSGFAVMGAMISAYLGFHGALTDYIRLVYLSTDSKGSPGSILFGFIPRMFDGLALGRIVLISSTILLGYVLDRRAPSREIEGRGPSAAGAARWYVIYSTLVLLAVYFSYSQDYLIGAFLGVSDVLSILRYVTVAAMLGVVIALPWFARRWMTNPDNDRDRRVAFWLLFSLVWMYSHGMSGVLEVHGLMVSLPLVLLIWWTSYRSAFTRAGAQAATVAFGLVCIVLITSRAYAGPYYWWGWGEPDVRTANYPSKIPYLRGMQLSLHSRTAYERIHDLIVHSRRPEDELFFFPHIALFNVITGMTNSAYAPVNYFDVCSDSYALDTARYLDQVQPAWIIEMQFPESVWRVHEDLFRSGRRSGQREITRTIQALLQQKRYTVVDVIETPRSFPIRVLHRVPQS